MGFLLGITFSLIFAIYRHHESKKIDKETDEFLEKKRKEELKELIVNRKVRVNLNEFNEDRFWELIKETSVKSKNSYKNQLGLLKDLLIKMSPEELIELDNLLKRLINDFISYDIAAASYIILKSKESNSLVLLMNVLMMKGRVFYKNACLNPNLIIGKEFNDIIDLILPDLILEVYAIKTDELIPLEEGDYIKEIKGEKWKENEIPSKYSELWDAYA